MLLYPAHHLGESMCRWPEFFFADMKLKFIQLEERHTSNGSNCRE
jgi:hypothetical protein